MKVETRQVTIEKEVYIAEDGNEFFDENECEEYEKECLEKKIKMYNYNVEKCDDLDDAWYINLETSDDIQNFIALCDWYGVTREGVDGPGVYMYFQREGEWFNLSTAMKDVEKIKKEKENDKT